MRSVTRRTRRALLVVMTLAVLTPLILLSQRSALADSLSRVRPTEVGEGWYWDRPANTPEEAPQTIGDQVGQQQGQFFTGDHLYVGWDPTEEDPSNRREMISGVAFDLTDYSIPVGSTITKFVITVLEHPSSSNSHTTYNSAQARVQGVVACPWPKFTAGGLASPMTDAPGRGGLCDEQAITGTYANAVFNPGSPAAEQVTVWTFDVTPIISKLWAEGENTAFSLEPNLEQQSMFPWATAFHNSKTTIAAPEARHGLQAVVSWVPPPIKIGGNSTGGGTVDEIIITELYDQGSALDFGADLDEQVLEAASPTGQLRPVTRPPNTRVLGQESTNRVPFWDGRLLMTAILTLLAMSGGGLLLVGQPAAESRPPGAVNALMEGKKEE